jgi:lipoprotein-releasing system permease protein
MTDPDLVIIPAKSKFFKANDSLISILNKEKEITDFSKTIEEKVFIDYHNKQKIAKLKGIDSNFFKVIPLDSTIFLGQAPLPETNELLMGVGMANELSLIIGTANNPEVIRIMVPKPGKGWIGNPRKAFNSKYFFPVGIYQTSSDHDKIYLYTSLKSMRDLLQLGPETVSQIELKTINKEIIPSLQKRLKEKLPQKYKILNRQEMNPLIFKMLNTENLMTYFILLLILILAIFNIVGSLIMIIIDKKDNIQTLKILGMETDDIKKIFLFHGLSMTLISGVAGLVFGLSLVLFQLKKPFLYIPQTSLPYPVEIHLSNIFAVLLTLLLLGFLSSLIASKRIK